MFGRFLFLLLEIYRLRHVSIFIIIVSGSFLKIFYPERFGGKVDIFLFNFIEKRFMVLTIQGSLHSYVLDVTAFDVNRRWPIVFMS